jgi:hypothetical protein
VLPRIVLVRRSVGDHAHAPSQVAVCWRWRYVVVDSSLSLPSVFRVTERMQTGSIKLRLDFSVSRRVEGRRSGLRAGDVTAVSNNFNSLQNKI